MNNISNKELLSILLSGCDNEYASNLMEQPNIKEFLNDVELKETMEQFLLNNLNISKTSKEAFMHRNTLMYRIEKVKKLLDLDVREFDDAVILKIIIMLANKK